VNITFFPNAKDMGIAEYAFMAGCLVAVCCGIRLLIRMFQFLEGPKPWKPWKRPNDAISGVLLNVKLRDTLVLEIVGLVIAVPTVLLAIKYLIIKYPPPIPVR
jgi:hypothetical protein